MSTTATCSNSRPFVEWAVASVEPGIVATQSGEVLASPADGTAELACVRERRGPEQRRGNDLAHAREVWRERVLSQPMNSTDPP